MLNFETLNYYDRCLQLNSIEIKLQSKGDVIYVMSRDQRVYDNHALLTAAEISKKTGNKLVVYFFLYSKITPRIYQQYDFMLDNLEKISNTLQNLGIEFIVKFGNFDSNIQKVISKHNIVTLIFDFLPYYHYLDKRKKLARNCKFSVLIIDTHNIVPCWITSDKEEYAARTFRPKIFKKIDNYLIEPKNELLKITNTVNNTFNKSSYLQKIESEKVNDYSIKYDSGEKAAILAVEKFIKEGIDIYNEIKNDPSKNGTSNLSPYLHFGQVSSLRVVLEILKKYPSIEFPFTSENLSVESFLEEIIVRKELSDNYCYYNKNYNNFEGAKDWAKSSYLEHADDKREYLYTLQEFELGKTHDNAWNAAQIQLLREGKIHGYMRMYWAKKIYEWSIDIHSALKIAIYLNDKYSIDGLDPNGYVGIMWSMLGVHDRPWFERKIYGKIRYMNFNGLKRKFDIDKYIDSYRN